MICVNTVYPLALLFSTLYDGATLNIDHIIKRHFKGSAKAMAREFNVTPGAISQWRDKLPPRRRDQIDLWLLRNGHKKIRERR